MIFLLLFCSPDADAKASLALAFAFAKKPAKPEPATPVVPPAKVEPPIVRYEVVHPSFITSYPMAPICYPARRGGFT